MDLSEFLAARLGEDEAAAKAAIGHLSGRWVIDSDSNIQDEETGGSGTAYVACGPYGGGLDEDHAAHILRHDPARVLREVEAGRKILADLPAYSKQRRDFRDHIYLPENADYHSGHADGTDDAARYVMRILASVYSDHPDYDEAWKP